MDFEAQDEETILSRITPLFDEMLLKRLQNKDAKTQDILSQYLAQIITQSSREDGAALSRSLQSVISPVISKEIADNKETMIDALYPIMGGMISKYVTQAIKEMMETINKKIEQGLSFERVKRKAKAKLTGVSETELLLEESSDARILSMFVIHKETSLLIAEAHLEDNEIDDAHMVASMASAIKDFINDWIQNNDTQNEVQLLSYGNATLYIESAGSVFIIAFLDTEPDHEKRTQINSFFASIVKKYASFFQTFDGDDTADEVLNISTEMKVYLNGQRLFEKTEKKNPAKIILILLALLLLGYGVYLFKGWYEQYSLEKTIYTQTGEKIVIEKEDDTLVLLGQVKSIEVVREIEKILKRNNFKKIDDQLKVPLAYLDKRFKGMQAKGLGSVKSVDEKLKLLEHSFATTIDALNEKILLLNSSLKKVEDKMSQKLQIKEHEIASPKQYQQKIVHVLSVKKEIYSALDKVFLNNPYYVQNERSLDFGKLLLFPADQVNYDNKAIVTVGKTFERYVKVLLPYKAYLSSITIEGHTDSSGIESDNIEISKKRALLVKHYLEDLPIVQKNNLKPLLRAEGDGSMQLIYKDGIEDKRASRRIKVSFKVDEDKILNILRGKTDD